MITRDPTTIAPGVYVHPTAAWREATGASDAYHWPMRGRVLRAGPVERTWFVRWAGWGARVLMNEAHITPYSKRVVKLIEEEQ